MPSTNGRVVAICIAPTAGAPMQRVKEVLAIAGQGLEGDRYAEGVGSFNQGPRGREEDGRMKRQVTAINSIFFPNSGFEYDETRRNLVIEGVELNWIAFGRELQVGAARLQGVKYCDPCPQPSKLLGKKRVFKEAFFDRGGIILEVIEGGTICEGDIVIPPSKDY